MRRWIVWAVLCLGALGCASAPPQAPVEPDWLRAARAREAAPMKPAAVVAKGVFRTQVPARILQAPKRDGESHWVSLSIGGDAPIDCFVYDDDLDLASSLDAFSKASFEAIGQQLGKVDFQQIEAVDAGVLAGGAYLSVDWIYRVATKEGLRIGQVKHLVVSKAGHSTYCQHNEVGYAKSFRRVVEELVRNLDFAAPDPQRPYYEEISVFTIQGKRVGVQHVGLTRDEAGDTRTDQRAYMLVPVDASHFQTSDVYGVEFVRPDGSLINMAHVESVNGELATRLDFDPDPEGGWKVHGTFQKKPLDVRIADGAPVGSWLGDVLSLRRAIAAGKMGAEIAMMRWVPDADPTKLVEWRTTLKQRVADDRFEADVSLAGIEGEMLADRAGFVRSGSVDLGHLEMRFERVFADGKL